MLEWLKTTISEAKVTDGVLDAEGLQKAIEEAFPKHAVPKSEFNNVNEKLKTANETIETMKQNNADNEKLQDDVKTYKAQIAKLETDAANTKREYALKDALKDAGAADADYIIYKQGGLDKFTFDKDGKPVGVEDILKPLRESSPHLFRQEQQGGYTPKGGGKTLVNNPFAKETYNMTEQGRMLRDNPQQAREMAAAAGVKL